MADRATLPARIEALADCLHMPGYPAHQAPVVRALAAEVAGLVAEMDALQTEYGTASQRAESARAEMADALKAAEVRLAAAVEAAATAEQRARAEILAQIEAASAAFRQGAGKLVVEYIHNAVRGGAA